MTTLDRCLLFSKDVEPISSSFAFRQRLNGVQRLGIWHTLAFRASRLNYRALVSTVINVH